ncbi:meiotic recombination protein SPO11-2 [Dendrobium catenatum]|uniref:meiotic recombination protein SPO11-2 n=1 Tax=Dendrobium catenatum TaxID=906689 RepID=UPI0009F2358E|nr:meiotic recombination protein SPO11-2 [Dendrobium catenatum]
MESDFPKSSLFSSDQRLCSAQILDPSQVRARIEVAVIKFLNALSSPTPAISSLPLICRKSSNSDVRCGLLSDVSSVFLSHSFFSRSFLRAGHAKAFIRVWKVMEMCFQILSQGKLVTQRELFYKLLCDSPNYFSSQRDANRAVQDVVALLRCTRNSLGIIASSRGTIIGRLSIKNQEGDIVDCSGLGPAGYAISGDLNLLSKLEFRSDARYIIVVEKDAIFQRLAEDCLFNLVPCILITAKGYPDIATRFLLFRLNQTFSELPILGLVDWNPAGLAILSTYKYGSIAMGLESYRYACNIKWLGLRKDDLQILPQPAFINLKPRDLQIAKSLLSSKTLQEKYRAELTAMVEMGHRVEIEALYFRGFNFLSQYIATKIVKSDYI